MNKTSIEWTDYTWNPVTGCHKISQGCKNCYAEKLTNRFEKVWGHKFRDVTTHPERLNEPFATREKLKGKKVFVCDMSDLFHEDVPFEFIYSVFTRMATLPDTVFQVLTKRIDRAVEFYTWFDKKIDALGYSAELISPEFPLPNVWLGTSCEDQTTADQRIPHLLRIPAVVRFLSCEPLLGPIDICSVIRKDRFERVCAFHSTYFGDQIHWVITGGESGHNARPVHPDWVRSLRDQCAAAEVPFFFKQWGEYLPFEQTAQPPFWRNAASGYEHDGHGLNFIDPQTGEAGKWKGHRWFDPMDAITICMETNERDCDWLKVGKGKSGNMLDGKHHREFPQTIPAQP